MALAIEIRHGNNIELLKRIESDSIHCVVTSPPYWQLRTYVNDPSIRKVMQITTRHNYKRAIVTNLYSIRATDPKHVNPSKHDQVLVPEATSLMVQIAECSDAIVLAWGTGSALKGSRNAFLKRERRVIGMLPDDVPKFHLGLTQGGHPRHPLYVPNAKRLERWT